MLGEDSGAFSPELCLIVCFSPVTLKWWRHGTDFVVAGRGPRAEGLAVVTCTLVAEPGWNQV